MIKVKKGGFLYRNKNFVPSEKKENFQRTIAYSVFSKHSKDKIMDKDSFIKIYSDVLASHDITYVGIIENAKAIGINEFIKPYVLTNCHNSLCAVGGTINEDDHLYGLTASKRYGGIYVPSNIAVIHTYIREEVASSNMIVLGSDSHTRYGPLGTLGIGEGGPELVKQLVGGTYDLKYPEVIAVNLQGKLRKGVGPQDVALVLIKEVFKSGYAKNKVLEFVGEGISSLPVEYRIGIDVMTTETTCLSSIWETDEQIREYLIARGRSDGYSLLKPGEEAFYDGLIVINLSKIEPMIALPFHPSNVCKLSELMSNPYDVLGYYQEEGRKLTKNDSFDLISKIQKDNSIKVDQAIIAGCAGGTFDNIYEVSNILKNKEVGPDLSFSVYCGSQSIYLDLLKKGVIEEIISAGGVVKNSFCGPCFGAGDVPNNNGFSIRHTTRNFENREGSKPNEGQIASVALMDARSIAATAANKGCIASALDFDYDSYVPKFEYDNRIYKAKVYNGFKNKDETIDIVYGPNISEWPIIPKMSDILVLSIASIITDPVTTTDELIPSGETSSFRSNPLRLAQFTLSRKDPSYVRRANNVISNKDNIVKLVREKLAINIDDDIGVGSAIFANKPGDGSAREQAASSQRVLGGVANIAHDYATKRYKSNLVNWGILPLLYKGEASDFQIGDIVVILNVKNVIKQKNIDAIILREEEIINIQFQIADLSEEEETILIEGCLVNYQKERFGKQ